MKFLDILILLLLLTLLGGAVYLLWLNMPSKSVEYEDFLLNVSEHVYSEGIQFYPNMRYRDRAINYGISSNCDAGRKSDAEKAFLFISENTILSFYNAGDGNAEIKVLCSDVSPKPEEKGHFVAGEGGPSEIINTTNYAVILSGKVSLFRRNDCDKPNVAIHEILHALGFNHEDNQKSIMYPLTKCDQEMSNSIINEINRIYKTDSLTDLAIEKVSANKTSVYLNFDISIANLGLKDSDSSKLIVYAGKEIIKDYELEEIDIGTRKVLTVVNLRIPRDTGSISFEVTSSEKELDLTNNNVEMKLVKVE